MDARADEVVSFWFEGDAKARMARWFTRSPTLDEEIRQRFGPLIDSALRGELDAWTATPRGSLALVILLDQLTRNVNRGSPASFAGDARAHAVSDSLRASGRDRELDWDERYLALMPTMHAEDVEAQRRGVAAFRALLAEATTAGLDEDGLGVLRSAVDYAEKHRVIIERFGRFPHRNRVLGRTSTPDEIEFLKQPGSSF
jgi:uncharacterized protein (DUF924 family)